MKQYYPVVRTDEALRYMGFQEHQSRIDPLVEEQMHRAVHRIESLTDCSYTYRVFPIHWEEQDGRRMPVPEGTSLPLPGNDIRDLLKDCSRCIVMAVTLGRKADQLLRRAQTENMADAVILDSCASSGIESLCDQLQKDLEIFYHRQGLYLTDRYSPGYGDLPLSLQPKICDLLSTQKRIGLNASATYMLSPSKSVTAILGLSEQPQSRHLSGCAWCKNREHCAYKKTE